MDSETKPKKPSCTAFFDDIYFCYSPVYQASAVYSLLTAAHIECDQ